MNKKVLKFGVPIALIVLGISYLAFSGVQETKSYYVTVKELKTMGPSVYSKRLRVAGSVQPGSIHRSGTHIDFVLAQSGSTVHVAYAGMEAPPDTFKDNAAAMAQGTYGRDGVFHATQLQAKCASHYAPAKTAAGAAPAKAKAASSSM